ncbi:MAG: thioredoxin fold domain-containing protein [Acidobacteria bacterium]|nr:thioredoxin fold domain-containing protein [Acidobacteriota bacterium]
MHLLHASILMLALSVTPVVAQTAAPTQLPAQAPAAAAKPAPPPNLIQQVRAVINKGDLAGAEAVASGYRKEKGITPEYLEAFSWLGRGALAQKDYDRAEQYALDAYDLCLEALESRKMDDEPRLPIAIGAAIEVRAQVQAARGNRSEAVYFLRREADTYKDTSIIQRINKNINLLSLEGSPAFEVASSETLGGPSPTLASLKGKPVVVFLWAHWCPDCKAMSPILDEMRQKYADTGLTILSPTQRYGYVAKRAPAGPAEELAYIKQTRQEFYPWMADHTVPVSGELFTRYGVSTTPTLVFVNRDGTVKLYHPGQMTKEQIEPVIRSLVAPMGSAH